jgi:hypothetical protein
MSKVKRGGDGYEWLECASCLEVKHRGRYVESHTVTGKSSACRLCETGEDEDSEHSPAWYKIPKVITSSLPYQ